MMELRSLIYTLLLVAGNAYACPNLSGTFTCKTGEVIETLVVTQEEGQNSVIVDTVQLLADDIAHPFSEDPSFRNAFERISCTDSVFRKHITGDYYQGDLKIGELDSTVEYSLVNNNLVETTTGKMSNILGEVPLDNRMVCERFVESQTVAHGQ